MTSFDKLWNYGDPEVTEAAFRAHLPETEGDENLRLQLLTQIARAQGLQQQFEAAHATLDGVEAHLSSSALVVRARYLLERGRVFNSAGRKEEARPLFLEAVEVAEAASEMGYAVDAAHMVAIVESGEQAIAWNERAIEMAEASDQPSARKWLGSLTNNLGWDLHGLGRYPQALTCFEKALAFRLAAGEPGTILIARWSVARCLRSLGRLDEALAIQEAIHEAREARGEPGGYNFEELAELHFALGEHKVAAGWFAKAHAILSEDPWLVRQEPERIARLESLATLCLLEDDNIAF